MDSVVGLIWGYVFDVASLLIAAGALVCAAFALRVAQQALAAAKASDLSTLKLKAHEGRARAERSFLSLQSACYDMRSRWNVHHDRHYPKLGAQDFRRDNTRHISEVENEGRKLLGPIAINLSEMGALDASALEDYIQRADQSAVRIEQLTLRLSPPKQLSV